MFEYFMKFFAEIFPPELDLLEVVVKYGYSPALKRARDLLNVLASFASER